jgi:NADH-quinone oxidoreductase subunit J
MVAASLIIGGALLVVSLKNLFRAALSLGLVLIGVAIAFVLLKAEFLAGVQILIYVGAILTLVVFAVMLTSKGKSPYPAAASRTRIPAAAFSILLYLILLRASGPMVPERISADAVSIDSLGKELITNLVLAFEVISLIFVAAIVGAVAAASAPLTGSKENN